MVDNIFRRLIAPVVPGGVIFLLVLIVSQITEPPTWGRILFPFYPLAAIAIALLLGWRFDRSRLIFATLTIGVAGWLLIVYGNPYDAIGRITTVAVLSLLPLNIALLALLKERGIFTRHGLMRWAILAMQPLVVWGLIHYRQYYWLGIFDTPIFPFVTLDRVPLEQPALIGFLLALSITGYRGLYRQKAMEAGMFWALALILYSVLNEHSHVVLSLFLASAILILIVTVVEITYTMAFRDELTALPGRRALNQALLQLGSRYTIAMIDVDHFKKFNDTYGHDIGDEVLKMVASQLTRVSGGGKSFRYGGEEFTILFPGKSSEAAHPHLERLRESIASTPFTVRGPERARKKPTESTRGSKREVRISVSIGAAERQADNSTAQEVIKAADKALYRAKKTGRNRVAR